MRYARFPAFDSSLKSRRRRSTDPRLRRHCPVARNKRASAPRLQLRGLRRQRRRLHVRRGYRGLGATTFREFSVGGRGAVPAFPGGGCARKKRGFSALKTHLSFSLSPRATRRRQRHLLLRRKRVLTAYYSDQPRRRGLYRKLPNAGKRRFSGKNRSPQENKRTSDATVVARPSDGVLGSVRGRFTWGLVRRSAGRVGGRGGRKSRLSVFLFWEGMRYVLRLFIPLGRRACPAEGF